MSDLKRYLVEDMPAHHCHEKSSSEELRNSVNRDSLQAGCFSQEDSETPIIGTLYVQKSAFKSRPEKIEASLKAKD